MKQFGLCMLALGMAASAFGTACFNGATVASMDTPGFNCTFDAGGNTYTLQDFTFLAVSILAPGQNANEFTVSEGVGANGGPVVTITPDPSLAISSILLANETFLIGFDITSDDPTIGFYGVTLGEQSSLSGVVGTMGTIAEEDCFGGALPTPPNVNVLSLGNGGLGCLGGGLSVGAALSLLPGVNANASVGIPLNGPFTNSVDVLKEVNISAVGVLVTDGTASISDITQGFTVATPEPGSFYMLLTGCALFGIALVRRRRRMEDK